MIIDTHSHIHFKNYFPKPKQTIAKARDLGVSKIITVGCTIEDSLEARKVAEHNPEVYWTLGVHPHDADKLNVPKMKEILQESKPIAIGEIGLDYYRNLQPRDVQMSSFREQLALAQEYELPVIIHMRESTEDVMNILAEYDVSVDLHCFTAGLDVARESWKRGYMTSFPGVITYPKNDELRAVAKEAPQELILVETDCPFLTPQKFRGQKNEPAYVSEVVWEIAKVRGVTFEEVAELTSHNAMRFFGIKSD